MYFAEYFDVEQLASSVKIFTLPSIENYSMNKSIANPIYLLSCLLSENYRYVIAWVLQTRSMAPSSIYKVSFSLRKIIQISVCQN